MVFLTLRFENLAAIAGLAKRAARLPCAAQERLKPAPLLGFR